MASLARKVARSAQRPFMRFFDPRFNVLAQLAEGTAGRLDGVSQGIEDVHSETADVHAEIAGVRAEIAGLRTEVAPAEEQMQRLYALAARAGITEQRYGDVDTRLSSIEALLARLLAEDGSTQARRLVGAPLAALQGGFCDLVAYADSPGGFRAQKGLYPFPGVRVAYADGTAALLELGPLFAAVPYAHRMLARLDLSKSRVLDLSPPEAAIAGTLVALGADCTRIDEPGPLHRGVERRLASDLSDVAPFDAIVCLGPWPRELSGRSDVEPIAISASGNEPETLLLPGGLLVTLDERAAPVETTDTFATLDSVHLRADPGGGWLRVDASTPTTVTLNCRALTRVGVFDPSSPRGSE